MRIFKQIIGKKTVLPLLPGRVGRPGHLAFLPLLMLLGMPFRGPETTAFTPAPEEEPAAAYESYFFNATCSGTADQIISVSGVDNPGNALGAVNGDWAQFHDQNDQLVLNLTDLLDPGAQYTLRWRKASSSNPQVVVEESQNGVNWSAASGSPFTLTNTSFFNQTITAGTPTRFLRIRTVNNSNNMDLDAVTYTNAACLVNPDLPPDQCPVDVVVVLDESGSIVGQGGGRRYVYSR